MKRLIYILAVVSLLVFSHYGLGLFSRGLAVSPSPSRNALDCKFESPAKNVLPFELRLPASECRLVEYYGSNVITITVEYPSMEVVKPHRRVNDSSKDSSVVFWIIRVDMEDYRENATTAGLVPFFIYEGVEIYAERGGLKKFTAKDGRSVFAHDVLDVISVKRLFGCCFVLKYMYSKKMLDIKRMDEFALGFLEKLKIE
ncbi:hypothetical protein PS838_02670 [Pseudomonas fluorescens]|jgi:hypothetical protein|nr:hypothetical protein PS838_02670 [Pseudomonas fluorescens]